MLLGDRVRSAVPQWRGLKKIQNVLWNEKGGNDHRIASFVLEELYGSGEAEVKDSDMPED